MDRQRGGAFTPGAAEIAGLQQRGQRRVEAADKGVRAGRFHRLGPARDPRQIGRVGVARDIDLPAGGVDRQRGGDVTAGAAEIAGLQQRVDGQRQRPVVGADAEAVAVAPGVEPVGHGHRKALAVGGVLKRNRRGEGHRAVAGVGDELTLIANFELLGTREFDVNLIGVVIGSDGEDLLHIVAGGAQLQVDAGVHVAQVHPFVAVQVVGVFRGVVTDGVAHFALHRAEACRGLDCALTHAARLAAGVDESFA